MEEKSVIAEEPRHLDFMSSICLFLISIYIVWGSLDINSDVGGPVYSSPGLLPLFIGSMLLLCSVILFTRSMKKAGFAGNLSAIRSWLSEFRKSKETMNMLMGIAVLAIFTFFLFPTFPFLLSSFIFMVFLMKVLDAGSYFKIILISACVSTIVYVLFQIIFKVPLP